MRYLDPFDATSMTTPGVVAAAAAAAMVAVMQGQRVKETKKERSRTFNLKVYGSFESKVRASSRRWELRVEGGAWSRASSRRSSFESKVRTSFKLELAGGPVDSVESKVFGASSRRSTFESKVGASSRRWELRVEGRTSGLGPVYTTSAAAVPLNN